MVKNGNDTGDQPNSAKRKKEADDDNSNGNSKKQRTRVSFSCGECHRRKQKCDRRMPCSHCVARKVPELCKAYTPGKSDQDISVRLLRLERIIEAALPQYCGSGSPGLFDSAARHENPFSSAPDDDNSEQEGTFQSGKWFGNSASGSIAPGAVIEQLEHAVMPSPTSSHRERPTSSYTDPSDSQTFGIPSNETSSLGMEPSAADNLKLLVQECGVSPHKISELLQELPPRRLSDTLIDHYFKNINWTRYPLPEREFRASYLSICADGLRGNATNPTDVRFLPLLFVVLAIGVRLSPEQIGGDARSRRVTSLRYYWSSRRSLLIAAAIQPDSLDIVLTRLLSARFLTFDRRITECWSQLGAAVRTAQALGLHRDGSSMGMEPRLVEQRRRIWSYLYHADRSYALVLGRPHAIQDDYSSTQPPLNVDDDIPSHLLSPPPLSSPTPMTFVILRHSLAGIIGRMVHHFQKVRPACHYADVLSLDDELMRFIDHLPPHFSMDPDTSLDDKLPYLSAHRFLLITEILFVRISLHRPYLLRRLDSDRYLRSRVACFEAALKDFQVRKSFRESGLKDAQAPLNNAYREFQTAMISGIYLVLDPKGPDAEAMHTILDEFIKDNEGIRDLDETTRRELKTVEFLKAKASQVGEDNGVKYRTYPISSSSTTPVNTEHPAHLLLGLQNSAPRPHATSPLVPSASTQSTTRSSTHSPTLQRLQHLVQADGATSFSVGSRSPHSDEETSAQFLLDNWCNSVSNAPSMDGSNVNIPWGSTGDAEFSGWVGSAPIMYSTPNPALLNGFDGNDLNYWEALVSHIQKGP